MSSRTDPLSCHRSYCRHSPGERVSHFSVYPDDRHAGDRSLRDGPRAEDRPLPFVDTRLCGRASPQPQGTSEAEVTGHGSVVGSPSEGTGRSGNGWVLCPSSET